MNTIMPPMLLAAPTLSSLAVATVVDAAVASTASVAIAVKRFMDSSLIMTVFLNMFFALKSQRSDKQDDRQ